MSSVSYLPSEISRLIYGYLRSDCNEDLADKFLRTCDSMKECRARIDVGFDTNFQGQFSLKQILNQYSALSDLIFKHVNKDTKCTHLNIVPSLCKLLHSRLDHFAKKCRPRETLPTSTEHEDPEIASKTRESEGTSVTDAIDNDGGTKNREEHRTLTKETESSDWKNRVDYRTPTKQTESCDWRNRQEYRTPTKKTESVPTEIIDTAISEESLPKKSDSAKKSHVWDHSVQKILATYSPRNVDRHRSVPNENVSSQKKRKFEETERGSIDIRTDSKKAKRRKSSSPLESKAVKERFTKSF